MGHFPDNRESLLQLADQLIAICAEASTAILAIYHGVDPIAVERKKDRSPVTDADRQAHDIILAGLQALPVDIPILSEEHVAPDFAERQPWSRYWLVDPLDGTKDFIERTGEFTINIALIENGYPVLGVIYVPLQAAAYYGGLGLGAWRNSDGQLRELSIDPLTSLQRIRVTVSSRNNGKRLQACMQRLQQTFAEVERVNAGSALKFCRIADGLADIYPRFYDCCEWDTAAGQGIIEGLGGSLLNTDFQRLRYNTRASLINPHFYVLAPSTIDWQTVLGG